MTALLCAQKQNTSQPYLLPPSGGLIFIFKIELISFYRRCDSRNLNLSPLCDLSNKAGPFYWKTSVSDVYKKIGSIPDYIRNKEASERDFYLNNFLKNREIMPSFIKASVNHLYLITDQGITTTGSRHCLQCI